MDYFKLLNLGKEPFSNSPDPDFFAHSREHIGCLQKIELSLRLHRGLSVVIGDVGAGKTTLCRQLIRRFAGDDRVDTHLILDPYFGSPSEFLSTVAEMFGDRQPENDVTDWQLKEIIKKNLFRRGVDEEKTVILIIDEGQKLPDFCLEILREFLNYETNEYKLLQIIIFAQREFEQYLKTHQNFTDRINLYHQLHPLNFRETRLMIQFRLERASEGDRSPSFFTYPALWVIYRATGGYPRKIVNLCHRIILNMIIENRSKARWLMVRSNVEKVFPEQARKWHLTRIWVLIGLLVVLVLIAWEKEYISTPGLLERGEDISSPQVIRGQIDVRRLGIEKPLPQARHKEVTQPAPVELAQAPAEVSTGMPSEEINDQDRPKPGLPVQIAGDEYKSEPKPRLTEQITGDEHKGKPEPEPPAQVAELEYEHKPMPEFLGQIAVNEHEWLAEMIRKVYGIYSNEYLNLVMEANQEIGDPDLITPGQVIFFPAVPVKPGPSSLKLLLVEVARKEKLEEAYRFLKAYSGDELPLRMISCWNSRQGLRFIITHKRQFADEESARNSLNTLPSALASGAKVLSEWDEDTVFFTSPML